MSVRYVQAAVSGEDHKNFAIFALVNNLTLSELLTVAVKNYIATKGKEEIEEDKRCYLK